MNILTNPSVASRQLWGEASALTMICLTFLSFFAKAHTEPVESSIVWSEGAVLMETEQKHKGFVHYDPVQGVVLVKNKENVQAFTARQVTHFQFYDQQMKMQRRFISLDLKGDVGYTGLTFYEVLIDGHISVLRKERKNANLHMMLSTEDPWYAKYAGCFDYFAFKDGSLVNLKEFKSVIYPFMQKDNKTDLDSMVQNNRLNLNWIGHMLMVVEYYNTLSSDVPKTTLAQLFAFD
jgi:hypothetical protein